ncbi:TcpQ domain-containing protein [Pandoraea sp.]|uniref:TrbG/VirB9 family P-type conjugative transfer protein n=1 Tax=Pandoraea sp. TaxID=1883445 RepID=UPI0011F81784|nr:TcpQ domain-containing protein [Pandoraea sp.]TAL56913.1 MAG: hypothetical protein EPN80_01820 [Pandoraea sp.]TAM17707.1 MAG: hypothetical protein EPN65_09820 [Pandoraea sp.]
MRRLLTSIGTALCLLCPPALAGAAPAHATPALYNFAWTIDGSGPVAPIQVFDDGQQIYLQFQTGAPIPAIFADTPGGAILLAWKSEPPYVVIAHLESHLSFRLGRQHVRAWRPPVAGPEGVAFGAAAPVHEGGAAALAVTPDQLRAKRTREDAATHDTSFERATTPTGPVARSYALLAQDGTVAMALARWAGMAGWTVSWDVSIAAPITAPSEPLGAGRFVPAVQAVLTALRQAGYPLNAVFGDRHVRIYELTSPSTTTTTTTAETLR